LSRALRALKEEGVLSKKKKPNPKQKQKIKPPKKHVVFVLFSQDCFKSFHGTYTDLNW